MKSFVCRMLVALMIWTPFQIAQAGMISTDSAQADRAALASLVTRADVVRELQALGLDAGSARARIAALSDEEVSSLAGQVHNLPAGADAGGLLLLVLVIALIWYVWKR